MIASKIRSAPDITVVRSEDLETLIKENARLREALEFYANKENWDDDFTPTIWDDGNVDLGSRARKALGGAK